MEGIPVAGDSSSLLEKPPAHAKPRHSDHARSNTMQPFFVNTLALGLNIEAAVISVAAAVASAARPTPLIAPGRAQAHLR